MYMPTRGGKTNLSPEARTVIDQLVAARRAAGITQAEMGERIGISASHISDMERGRNEPRVGVVFAYAAILGLSYLHVG